MPAAKKPAVNVEHLPEGLKEVWATMPQDKQRKVLQTMGKYGENRWWLSRDKAYVSLNQLFEPVLIVNFSDFHEGMETLLGRPVQTVEFGLNLDGLKTEARERVERAGKMHGDFKPRSDGAERSIEELGKILRTLKEQGKDILIFDGKDLKPF